MQDILIDRIDAHPRQPRQTFDAAELEQLAASMNRDELLQPVLVRPNGKRGRYQLIFGERRLRAAKLAGWETIQAVVRKLSDAEALRILGDENCQRVQLNPLERAAYLKSLSDPADVGGAGMTDEQIAGHFQRSVSWVKNVKRLVELPDDWKARVISGEMCETKARAVLSYKDSPAVLAAIADQLEAHPDAWRGRDQFEENCRMVAERVAALAQPAAGRSKPVRAVARRVRGKYDPAKRVQTAAAALKTSIDELATAALAGRAVTDRPCRQRFNEFLKEVNRAIDATSSASTFRVHNGATSKKGAMA